MSRIINVVPHEDYTLTILFSDGSSLLFNMQKQVETIRFKKLKERGMFAKVQFNDKSIFWPEDGICAHKTCPLRLTLDNILFSLRDAQ